MTELTEVQESDLPTYQREGIAALLQGGTIDAPPSEGFRIRWLDFCTAQQAAATPTRQGPTLAPGSSKKPPPHDTARKPAPQTRSVLPEVQFVVCCNNL